MASIPSDVTLEAALYGTAHADTLLGRDKVIRLQEDANIHQMKTVLSPLRLTSRFQRACISAEKRINVKA